MPRITELLNRLGYPPLKEAFTAVEVALSSLEKNIIETYIEHKSDPLVGTIEPSMYLGRFDWDTQQTPTDLRPYAKEIICNIIAVHAEVIKFYKLFCLTIILLKLHLCAIMEILLYYEGCISSENIYSLQQLDPKNYFEICAFAWHVCFSVL